MIESRRGRSRSSERGILLIECLVYIAVGSILLGLAFLAFYRVLDNAKSIRRNSMDIGRVLQAGERWRDDIRRATGELKRVGGEPGKDQALHIPQEGGEVVYYFTGRDVLRRASEGEPWTEALTGVNASDMILDTRPHVDAWRWEVEIDPGRKKVSIRPRFTFLGVPAFQERP